MLGGLITLVLSIMTALSAISNILFDAPFAADYELVKHFVAIAIFMFLPYCQLTGSNVTVDIFTEGMGERGKAAMAAFSSLFALTFSLLLLVQMYGGLLSYIRYRETTPVLGLPLWTAFPPILVSLALLVLASIITLSEGWKGFRSNRPQPPHPIPNE
ncbi:TRAP transporter small permease [Mesorhizobium camelthorni]|uniref:TRAP transporter small permease protein n=2 Tax=Allomesorhizobium camelthorni TaxID=475069 RepID=A0A6G4WK58_9HYPH|nr:TRAP transporter small permease [Mesorhizobium camelthorni]